MASNYRLYWLAALALVASCVIAVAVWVSGSWQYFRDRRAGRNLVVQLQQRRPSDVDPETWDFATGWAVTAYCNVCFSRDHVSAVEQRRFNVDLAKRLREPVSLGTVDWVWERLGQTGPHGKRYRERFEPDYREGVAALRGR